MSEEGPLVAERGRREERSVEMGEERVSSRREHRTSIADEVADVADDERDRPSGSLSPIAGKTRHSRSALPLEGKPMVCPFVPDYRLAPSPPFSYHHSYAWRANCFGASLSCLSASPSVFPIS